MGGFPRPAAHFAAKIFRAHIYRLVTPHSGATCKAQDTLIITIFDPMKGVFRVFSPRTSRIRVAASPKTLFFGSDVRFLYEGNRIRIGATVF